MRVHPDLQRRAWFDAMQRRLASRIGRALMLWLVFVMTVAPMWHVCAMAGPDCHQPNAEKTSHSHEKPKVLICGLPQIEVEKCDSHEICLCEDDEFPASTQHKTPQDELSASPHFHQNEHCLARLLWGFPATNIAWQSFSVLFFAVSTPPAFPFFSYSSAHGTLQSARAPPIFLS